jgi:PhoH-like ATPase
LKKTYILDTNVLIHSPYSLFSFDENNVVIADVTLEELDNLKLHSGEVGANARETNRILDRLREKGNISKGVELPSGGKFWVEINHNKVSLPETWDKNKPDNRILKVAKALNGILVSKDISVRLKSDIIEVPSEDYKTDQVSIDDEQFQGRADVFSDDKDLNFFYKTKEINPNKLYKYNEKDNAKEEIKLYTNQFLKISSGENLKKTALGRYDGKTVKMLDFTDEYPFGIRPKNTGQIFAQECLLKSIEEAPLVILKGPAGTAKTFYSLAAGLHQTVNLKKYQKILIVRPNIKFDEDIGFLKGTESEKIAPLIRPVMDNLELLLNLKKKAGEDRTNPNYLFDTGVVQAQALAYLRGRNITDTWVIIDEAQNMTPAQALGIITRVGIGTKLILAGDPAQVDHPRLDSRSNGLSYASEKMKNSSLCWQVTFNQSECTRSPLAQEAIDKMSLKGLINK